MKLLRVFYEPEKVFAEIQEKRAWALPLVALLLVSLLSTIVVINMVGMETIVRNQLESNPRVAEALGPAKIDEAVQRAASSPFQKVMSYCGAPVFSAISLLIVGAVFFGLLQIMDAASSYSKVLAVCAYGFFAYSLVTGIMSVIILAAMSDYAGVDLRALVRLNPTIFLDKASTARPLYSLAGSLDLLSFWLIFLLGLGLSKVATGLRLGKALLVVILPWVVFVAGKAGLSVLF